MATLSLNSTGRSRITHNMFDAQLDRSDANQTLSIDWDLSSLSLGAQWSLFVDYWNDDVERRQDLDPQGALSGSNSLDLGAEFSHSVVRIRIVVVTRDSKGLPIIRAESVAVTFTTTGESSAKSLLPVQPDGELLVPWELDFRGGDVVLRVSNKGGLWGDHFRSSPMFKPLIVGPIVFQIAFRLIAGVEDLGSGMANWKRVLESAGLDTADLSGMSPEEMLDLAGEISTAFQLRSDLVGRLVDELKGGEE